MSQEPLKLDYGVRRKNGPPPAMPWTPWQKRLLLTLIIAILFCMVAGLIEVVRWLRLAIYA